MGIQSQKPIKIFYCYTHADKKFRDDLERHLAVLKRSGTIQTWSDQDITPGSDWEYQITSLIDQSDIILLLVSPDFMASEVAFDFEMQHAMEQRKLKNTRVIPIILRPTAHWQTTLFGHLRSLPTDAKPVTDWKDRDAALADIAYGIRRVAIELQEASIAQTDWVDEGDRQLQFNNYRAAIDAYEQAIRQNHNNDVAYIGKGNAYRGLRQYSEALFSYDQAIRLAPNNALAYISKANTLRDIDRLVEALVVYRQAIHLEPVSAAAYREMGNVLYELGDYHEALDAYDHALSLSSDDAVIYISKGNVLQGLKHYEEALLNYQRALMLSPTNIVAYLSRGEVYLHLQQFERALQDYQRALVLDPRNVAAYIGRGNALVQLHRYKEAVADYDAANLLDPNNANVYYAKAQALYKLGQTVEASVALEQARKLGLNIEENPAMLDKRRAGSVEGQLPDTRIQFVQQFLTKAGFDLRPLPNEIGFLALAQIPLWKRRFPRGLYVRVLLDSSLDQRTVSSIYRSSREHSDCALVVINQQPELSGWGEINILRGEFGHRRFVCLPIDEAVIQKGITLNKELLTLQHYIDRHLGKGFDPYDVHDPVSGAVSFFGRQQLTEDIMDALRRGQRMGLFGIQKMGKTSVLQQLQKRAEFPIAYVYLNTNDDLNRIYDQIIDIWTINGRVKNPHFKWTRPIPKGSVSSRSDFDGVVKSLLDYLGTLAEMPPLLGIFLDEIEHIVPTEGDERMLQLYVNLMDTLRGLQQETSGLALLVAGVHPSIARQNYFWGTQKNPMHQVIIEQFLPPLSREDCSSMICSLGQQINLRYEEAALEYILDLSGCHPFLARRICSLAYKRSRNMPAVSVDIVDNVVYDFIRNPATASYFDESGLWRELSLPYLWGEKVGQANLSLLNKLASANQDLSENELCAGLDKKVAFTSFHALAERSIIFSPDNSGYYRITFGLFRDWIRFHQLGIE